MKEIVLTGTVGDLWWDENCISAKKVREAFSEINDTQVRITIDSMGGDFFEMITIFNIIRDYARSNPATQIETYIQGSAMSAASMIALAAKAGNKSNLIKVEDNSLFLIHNAWTIIYGNQYDLESEIDLLKRIDNMQVDIYERKTGKSREELAEIMKKSDFMYGQEIVDAGFADEVIETADTASESFNDEVFTSMKDEKIINAKCNFDKMVQDLKEHTVDGKKRKISAEAVGKYLAMSTTFESSTKNIKAKQPVNGEESDTMDIDELKTKHPDVYAAVFDAGVKAERSRVESHIKMATDSGDINAAVDFIKSGVNCNENEVVAKYHETFTKCAMAKIRASENPDVIQPPKTAEEGEKDVVAAFLKETGLQA